MPGDVFRNMSGPASWLASIALGLAGAVIGYLIFTVGLGIGDTDMFDFGGIISAIIGTPIVLVVVGFVRPPGHAHRLTSCWARAMRSQGYVSLGLAHSPKSWMLVRSSAIYVDDLASSGTAFVGGGG